MEPWDQGFNLKLWDQDHGMAVRGLKLWDHNHGGGFMGLTLWDQLYGLALLRDGCDEVEALGSNHGGGCMGLVGTLGPALRLGTTTGWLSRG